jgi:hypothetical protein
MRRSIAVVAVSLVFAALPATAFATPTPNSPGQPNQSCETLKIDHAGFTTSAGFENAESHYADPSILPLTANQVHTVSQYDVACFQQASH